VLAGAAVAGAVFTSAMTVPSAVSQAATASGSVAGGSAAGNSAAGNSAAGNRAAGSSTAHRRVLPAYVPLWSMARAAGGTAARDLGPAKPGAPVAARVYLAGRDPKGLAGYAAAVSDPHNAMYRHYLRPAQVRQWFGPTGQQIAAVRSWLTSAGLRVSSVTAHYLAVSGTAAAADRAFGVAWHSYRVTAGLQQQGRRVASTPQQAPTPAERVSAPWPAGPAVLTVAPTETGIPGYAATARPASHAAPTATAAATAAATATGTAAAAASQVPAPSRCSGYFGQRLASGLPRAYGKTAPYAACGYTPQQLRAAYGVPPGLTGRGVRTAVVGVWRTPSTPRDLATFARRHGEPLRRGQFTESFPRGLAASCRTEPARFAEDFGDVELVHAMAPAADLSYFAAKCDDDGQALPMLDEYTAITDQDSASIVSSAWNARYNEATVSPGLVAAYEQIFEQGAAEGIGIYVDSDDEGDNSSVSPTHQPTVSYPDSDPWVTGVGGTSLAIGPGGRYEWETAWGDHWAKLAPGGKTWSDPPGRFIGGGGGGASTVFGQPYYQRGVVPGSLSHAHGSAAPMRVLPDIAADASSGSGMLVGIYIRTRAGQPVRYHEFAFAGTSSSVQLIAGIQADAQQAAGGRRIGFANPAIYARYGTADYHDVTARPRGAGRHPDAVGPGRNVGTDVAPYLITLGLDQSLAAAPGYDDVTGVGTPAPGYLASWRRR
jgi:subtilase family serine protease